MINKIKIKIFIYNCLDIKNYNKISIKNYYDMIMLRKIKHFTNLNDKQ